MVKLSKAQIGVLELLDRGGELRKLKPDGYAFTVNEYGDEETVNKITFRILIERNLIQLIRGSIFHPFYYFYEITPAGRAALEAASGE